MQQVLDIQRGLKKGAVSAFLGIAIPVVALGLLHGISWMFAEVSPIDRTKGIENLPKLVTAIISMSLASGVVCGWAAFASHTPPKGIPFLASSTLICLPTFVFLWAIQPTNYLDAGWSWGNKLIAIGGISAVMACLIIVLTALLDHPVEEKCDA